MFNMMRPCPEKIQTALELTGWDKVQRKPGSVFLPEKGMGIVYFTGPTMGYLLGFLVTVYLTGFLKFDNNFLKNFVKLCVAVSFIYLFGLLWLGSLIGWDKPIFELGAQPFLLAELFKVLILTILIPKVLKFRI